jgi:type IV pilus assembly protein PilC
MPQFSYKAVRASGDTYEGTIEAPDKFTVYRELKASGDMVVSVEEPRMRKSAGSFSNLLKRIKMHERIIFARNLGAMLEAGLSLSRALSVLERQSKNPELKRVLTALDAEVSKGQNLSDAMVAHPKVFSNLFVSMVKAGEESGKLAESLKVVAEQMERSYLLKKKVRGALMYPSVVVSVMVVIGVLMLIYVVPTLTSTFKELNVPLPASTRLVIGVSDFLSNNVLLALVLALGAGFGLYAIGKSPIGRRFFDSAVLRIPVVGVLVKETNAARTARTLASLLTSGVEVVGALSTTRDVMQNSLYKAVLLKAADGIQKGLPISAAFLENERLYPVFVGEMISVGEETGKLSDMLMRVASFYENEVEQKTKDMSTIIEPFLMVIIGVTVGFFAVAMISPTYSLMSGI